MDALSFSLLGAAAAVGLSHTLLGPDHYLPLIMLSRARAWTARRTALITVACGSGHVLSSLLLGSVGVALGIAVNRIEQVDSGRGGFAAWALVAFGVAYGAWGLRRGIRRVRGIEPHRHGGHVHWHSRGDRAHRHDEEAGRSKATLWTLFLVFVLGPCEPLVPLFILPASRGRWDLAAASAAVFGVTTVATMTGAVLLGRLGLGAAQLAPLERWSHALAGGIIAVSGFAILFLGL